MNIFLTGATGFIGSHIAKVLCRRHSVSALVRPGSQRQVLAQYPIRLVEGDLGSPAFLAGALQGCDLVIHAAAKASDWGDYPEFHEANVQGSVNLIQALPAHARLIHISSNAVLGEEDCPIPKDEKAPYAPVLKYVLESVLPSGMNHYRVSKALAEQMLIRQAEIRGLDLTVIRPVWVYGPREFHAGPFEYCQTVQAGAPALPGTTDNRFHVIYVEDLARLVREIAEHQPRGIRIYHAGNPDVPGMEEYWQAFCRELGVSKPANLPKWAVYPAGILLELLWRLLGVKSPPLLTRARLYLFYASNVYSVEALRQDFPAVRFTPLDRGVKKTVRWWRFHRYLS